MQPERKQCHYGTHRLHLPTASERTPQQASEARRYKRYDTVRALLTQGLSQRHIPLELVGVLLRNPEARMLTEQRLLTYVVQDDHVDMIHRLGQQFQQIIRQRQPALLNSWIAAALASNVPDLQPSAITIRRDYAAVRAALQEEWSSGQIEGQITRVTLIKQRMYRRANFDLLRLHILGGDQGRSSYLRESRSQVADQR